MTLQQFYRLQRGERVRWCGVVAFEATVQHVHENVALMLDDGLEVFVPPLGCTKLEHVASEVDQARR